MKMMPNVEGGSGIIEINRSITELEAGCMQKILIE